MADPNQRGQPEGEGPLLVPERMRIEDTEAWFRSNSLLQDAHNETLDQQETRQKFDEYRNYQDMVHGVFFADEEAKEKEQQLERTKALEKMKGGTLVLRTKDGDVSLPLHPFASSCETIFTLACSKASHQSNTNHVECLLSEYSLEATKCFSQCVTNFDQVELSADFIPEIACIADFLQNGVIRDAMEEILKQSTDRSNCLSMCQLADQIGMTGLFEHSLQHMIRTLGEVEEGSDCWEELTPELRERVLLIKNAIQSSVHSQRSKLFFNDLGEYISIFAERVQYMRERLAEAKEQLLDLDEGSRIWTDTQLKIYKQEQRVQTLAAALAAQKQLFGAKRLVPPSSRKRQE